MLVAHWPTLAQYVVLLDTVYAGPCMYSTLNTLHVMICNVLVCNGYLLQCTSFLFASSNLMGLFNQIYYEQDATP